MHMKKFMIIDGSAILHRAFHALPPFTAPDGTPTNAVHGFIKMFLSLVDKLEPDYVAVAFDTPKPTFRKKLLATYQAHRPKAPEEFKVQVPLVQEFLDKAGVAKFLVEGYEADDVIGTIVRHRDGTLKKYVVTGDKDMLQLVDQETMVIMPVKGVSALEYMDSEAVMEKLGVSPEQVIDYKAMVGDSSDNYVGIRGIGPKKAAELLKKYGNLEEIYRQADSLDLKTRGLLAEHREDALLSKELATILTDLDLGFDLEKCRLKMDPKNQALLDYLDRLSLRSIKKQVTGRRVPAVDKEEDNQLSFF